MKLQLHHVLPIAYALHISSAHLLPHDLEYNAYNSILDSRDFRYNSRGLYGPMDDPELRGKLLFSRRTNSGVPTKATKKLSSGVPSDILKKMANTCKQKKTKRSILVPRAPNSPKPSDGLFDRSATVVDMGAQAFMEFTKNKINQIGTIGLCGCPVLVIAGNGGAIVAHINPASDKEMEMQTGAAVDLFNTNNQALAGAKIKIFIAKGVGDIDVYGPKVANLITTVLSNNGMTGVVKTYDPFQPASQPESRRGTFVVISNPAGQVVWFLNDQALS